jgi:hypothetical protein
MAQYPVVNGTTRPVGQNNQYGPDGVGWDLSVLATIAKLGPGHDIPVSCVTTTQQEMTFFVTRR